jgi:hypothetical protein
MRPEPVAYLAVGPVDFDSVTEDFAVKLQKVLVVVVWLYALASLISIASAQYSGETIVVYDQTVVQTSQPVVRATPVRNVVSAVGQAAVNLLTPGDDALAEVNAARARRGLRPFLPDPALNQAARACAQLRASRRIQGHLSNDFAHVPAGTFARGAGCAAWPPGMGWGACCTYENWTYAGAAWAMGADGQRYMHLFVR